MNRMVSWLGGLALGAGFVYLYDPEMGRRRRALIRDRFVSMRRQSDEALEKTARDLRNRMRGLAAEVAAATRRGEAADWIIEERVRAQLGRFYRRSGSIEVQSSQGVVTLRGPILASDVNQVVSAVSGVKGVRRVEKQLEVRETAGDIPALQGSPHPQEPRFELLQENWSPTARLLTGLAGGGLVLYGMSRRGLVGSAVSLMGLGLAARGVTNLQLKRLIGLGGGRRAVDVQKTIQIDAPVEEVYRFWSNTENFPRFMAHVRQMRDLGNGLTRWTVAGPAGTEVEFDAITTQDIPNQVIAWKSRPDEAVKSAGIVQFQPTAEGGTRLAIRMSYNPPAGALGHAVATLFGVNPKQAMDEDLARLKSLLETGKTSAPRKGQVTPSRMPRAAGGETS